MLKDLIYPAALARNPANEFIAQPCSAIKILR